jgi:hypothetical protein
MPGKNRKSRPSITAGELARELANDPKYQAMMAEKEAKREAAIAKSAPIFAKLMADLDATGCKIESLSALINSPAPTPLPCVPVLLKWLSLTDDEAVLSGCLRCIMGAKERKAFDGQALADLYGRTSNHDLQWLAVNAAAITRPTGIEEWIARLKESPYWAGVYRDAGGK